MNYQPINPHFFNNYSNPSAPTEGGGPRQSNTQQAQVIIAQQPLVYIDNFSLLNQFNNCINEFAAALYRTMFDCSETHAPAVDNSLNAILGFIAQFPIFWFNDLSLRAQYTRYSLSRSSKEIQAFFELSTPSLNRVSSLHVFTQKTIFDKLKNYSSAVWNSDLAAQMELFILTTENLEKLWFRSPNEFVCVHNTAKLLICELFKRQETALADSLLYLFRLYPQNERLGSLLRHAALIKEQPEMNRFLEQIIRFSTHTQILTTNLIPNIRMLWI